MAGRIVTTLLETRVKDLGGFFSANANLKTANILFEDGVQKYSVENFAKGKVNPVFHIMAGLGVIGYCVSYSHLSKCPLSLCLLEALKREFRRLRRRGNFVPVSCCVL